jgi:peptide/nickel transport system substrate-binding protein
MATHSPIGISVFFWEGVIATANCRLPVHPSNSRDGKAPKVEIIDERTIRYSWEAQPYFVQPGAQRPLPVPAGTLSQLHGKYTPEEEVLKLHKGA